MVPKVATRKASTFPITALERQEVPPLGPDGPSRRRLRIHSCILCQLPSLSAAAVSPLPLDVLAARGSQGGAGGCWAVLGPGGRGGPVRRSTGMPCSNREIAAVPGSFPGCHFAAYPEGAQHQAAPHGSSMETHLRISTSPGPLKLPSGKAILEPSCPQAPSFSSSTIQPTPHIPV